MFITKENQTEAGEIYVSGFNFISERVHFAPWIHSAHGDQPGQLREAESRTLSSVRTPPPPNPRPLPRRASKLPLPG